VDDNNQATAVAVEAEYRKELSELRQESVKSWKSVIITCGLISKISASATRERRLRAASKAQHRLLILPVADTLKGRGSLNHKLTQRAEQCYQRRFGHWYRRNCNNRMLENKSPKSRPFTNATLPAGYGKSNWHRLSCVAILEGGKPIITNSEGGRTTPSVVGFGKVAI